jgi:hypothetical protein
MFGTCFVFFPPASWRLAEQILVCGSMRNVSVSVNLRTATTFLVLRKRRKQACNILAREDLLSRRFDRAGSYGFIRWAINRELSGRVELFELHFLLAGFICFWEDFNGEKLRTARLLGGELSEIPEISRSNREIDFGWRIKPKKTWRNLRERRRNEKVFCRWKCKFMQIRWKILGKRTEIWEAKEDEEAED